MKILLNSLNYSPELTGIGKYNGELCSELVKRGMTVSAIVAPPYYPEWKIHSNFSNQWFYKELIEGVTVFRCPLYVPNRVNTLKRIIHLTSFAITSALAMFSQALKKPDVIFLVQPTLLCAPAVLLFGQLTGAKTIMHIQDFEVDAMLGLGLNIKNRGVIASFARKFEAWLIKKFDLVSSISHSMLDKARVKGIAEEKLILFPNWSDIEFVSPLTSGDKLKQDWGFTSNDKIILYAGNIGEKQGLDIVLKAAQTYINESHIKFVFVGTGASVERLKNSVSHHKLVNVHFFPLQPWQKVPEMLALADIHLVIQKKGAADVVLPSKLTNILAAGGHAIVTSEQNTELGRIAENFPGVYQCCEPENPQSLIASIASMLKKDTKRPNIKARLYAEQYLAKEKIIEKFVNDLNNVVFGEDLFSK